MKCFILPLALLLASCATTPAGSLPTPGRSGIRLIPPVDEASQDPSFEAYRQRLLEAVKRRDVDAVVAASRPEIRTGFGAEGGEADLRKRLTAAGSRLWEDLEELLSLGGTFSDGPGDSRSFCAPYTYSTWPGEGDPFTEAAVIERGAPLRAAPGADAPVLLRLDYEILGLQLDQRRDGWQGVTTADGQSGWVREVDIRSHLDYRACFSSDPEWKMDLLVAGD